MNTSEHEFIDIKMKYYMDDILDAIMLNEVINFTTAIE